MLGEFWESISRYTSTAKLTEMAVNLLPSINKKKSPQKKSPPARGPASKRKRTPGPKSSVPKKKSKTGK